MNRFFDEHAPSLDIPSRVYAKLEGLELQDTEERLFVLEGVNADWLDGQGWSPSFWAEHWRSAFNEYKEHGDRPMADTGPFEEMPLFRLEVYSSESDHRFQKLNELSGNNLDWAEIYLYLNANGESDIYTGISGEARRISVDKIAPIGLDRSRLLSASFDMVHWPVASQSEVERTISGSHVADFLVAYDVGQGSACGLVRNGGPFMYFDLGCGVYRNHGTTPMPLKFCWTYDPPIVLSHWDADHWAGALKDPCALRQTWLAPRQSIGPVHSAFARSILAAGGRLIIWDKTPSVISISIGNGQHLNLIGCTGSTRNDSGIALRVDDRMRTQRSWLLTGDAGYHKIPNIKGMDYSAIVVPHHGAKMNPNSIPPGRSHKHNYARLLYSFGPNNKHGRTSVQHPTHNAIQQHYAVGWDHGSWIGNPGQPLATTIAGADVLSTARHLSTHLGGAVAGWGPIPASPNIGCNSAAGGKSKCTLSMTQF